MKHNKKTRGLLGRPLRGSSGFTLIETMLVALVSVVVAMAAAVAYQGTVRSWRGTAALLELQRDASLGIEMVQTTARAANRVEVYAGGDSLEIYHKTATGDSLVAMFYLDAGGCMRDINGTMLAEGVDSLHFSSGGGDVHVDLTVRDDLGTPSRSTDDQAVFISSSAICRNW